MGLVAPAVHGAVLGRVLLAGRHPVRAVLSSWWFGFATAAVVGGFGAGLFAVESYPLGLAYALLVAGGFAFIYRDHPDRPWRPLCERRGYHDWFPAHVSEFSASDDRCLRCDATRVLKPYGVCLDGTHLVAEHYRDGDIRPYPYKTCPGPQ